MDHNDLGIKAEVESNRSSTSTIRTTQKKSKRISILTLYTIGVWTWTAYFVYNDPTFFYAFRSHPETQTPHSLFYGTSDTACPFPLPKTVLNDYPLRADEESIIKVSKKLDKFLQGRVSQSDIDSLSIAVVTPFGNLFEKSYGILRANETKLDSTAAAATRPVISDSIYRIASISKMFTMLETLVLRERGVLNLDDPVEKYLPEIHYPTYGWSDYLKGKEDDDQKNRPQVTLRQLASHMSGIGRDYPPIELNEWPSKSPIPFLNSNSNSQKLPKPIHTKDDLPLPNRSYESLKDSINKYPLANLPSSFPIYSNSGIDLLGLANIAANKLASTSGNNSNKPIPKDHAELLQRDIFEPLGLNRSFFKVPYGNELLVRDLAIPRDNSDWVDFEFDNSDAPAGGQYTSVSDLSTTMKSFLNPELNNGVVSSNVIREWLHPMYTWRNGFQEVGAPWEINILNDGHRTRMYTKSGSLPGYHSEFVIVPDYSFGIIVLLTGTYSNTASIVQKATSIFYPIIENLLEQRVKEEYVGKWISNDTQTEAKVEIIKGGLYLTKLIIRNYDVLKIIQDADISFSGKQSKPYPIALWNTERSGEFRLAFGRKSLNKDPSSGCMPYWISLDNGLFSRGAPIDLIYWDGDELVYPSGGVRFIRA